MKVRFEWTIPNALSILRLLLIPVFAVLYLTSGDHPERLYWSVGALLLSGLSDALERFEEDEMVGVVRFTKEDCVRSALCQRTLQAYY